jgi:hypothetical protein
MAGQRSRLQAISRRCFAITALLLLALIVLPLARNTRTLTPTERRLVGSWTTPSPQGPRITRVWAFTSDRRVMIRDISDETGAVAGEASGDEATWFVDGQTIVIRRPGTASLFERALGMRKDSWDRYPIVSVSDDALVIGYEVYRVVLKRSTIDPSDKLR